MIFDYAIGHLTARPFPVYGHLVPRNEWGVVLILLALVPALAACLGHGRQSPARQHALTVAALVAYAGAYVASCRWLDDLFVNLAHPYNLWHSGRFSVSPGSMVNGTVEIVYYSLLTPFAGSRASLIVANYALGLVIGGLHIGLAAALMRRVPAFPRLAGLLLVSLSVPLIQTFSGGYGNGLVSLAVFYGVFCLLQDRDRPLPIYGMSALLPLLRPDALLYSAALIVADSLLRRRLRPLWWLPTLGATLAYFALVRALYGDWAPVPMSLKAVSPADLWRAVPGLPAAVAATFFGNSIHVAEAGLAGFFFLLPDDALSGEIPLTKRAAGVWLATMFPALLFFRAAATVGHNPTVGRYFVGFEMALAVVAAFGLARLIGRYSERPGHRGGAGPPSTRRQLAQAGALSLALVGSALFVGTSLRRDDGRALGMELGMGAFRYIETNTFAARYCASVFPPGWRIAVTEMDTFGFMSGREILDLWGFSNRDIARSPRRNEAGIKSNPGVFLASDVPVLWLRTVPITTPDPQRPDTTQDVNVEAHALPAALARFPNLSPHFHQLGDLETVFRRYDVVRIHHTGARRSKGLLTVLLVRKDVTPMLCRSLARSGHVLQDAVPFDMPALRRACARSGPARIARF